LGALAQFYVRTNNWTKAKEESERVLKQHQDDVDDLHRLIEVDLNLNGRTEAESLNNALLKKNPQDSYAHLIKGRLALADGNLDAAVLEFNSVEKYRPDWAACISGCPKPTCAGVKFSKPSMNWKPP
jgi:lipopolysaccharide biosynthesis regulator YciM